MPISGPTSRNPDNKLVTLPANATLDLTVERVALALFLAATSYALARYTLSRLQLKISPNMQTAGAVAVSAVPPTVALWPTQPPATSKGNGPKSDGDSESSEGSEIKDPPTNVDLTPYVERQLAEDPHAPILRQIREQIRAMECPTGEEIAEVRRLLGSYPTPKDSIEYMLLSCAIDILQTQYDFLPLSAPIEHETDSTTGRWLEVTRNRLNSIDNPLNITKEQLKDICSAFARCTSTTHRGEYNRLKILIERIEENFYERALPAGEVPGEIKEEDLGDCAVLALARLLSNDRAIDPTTQAQQANALRVEAVALIRERWKDDTRLKGWVCNSIAEHYLREVEKTEDDIHITETIKLPNYKELIAREKNKEAGKDEELIVHLETIVAQLEVNLQKQKANKSTFDQIIVEVCSENDDRIAPVLDRYLEEIAKPGVYLGSGELHILGKSKNVLIHIYRPAGMDAAGVPQVVRDNNNLLGPEDLAVGYREVNMIRRGAHYNSYYPVDNGAGVGSS